MKEEDKITVAYREAAWQACIESHQAGIPYFTSSDGYIYAHYPDGRKVAIEKIETCGASKLLRR